MFGCYLSFRSVSSSFFLDISSWGHKMPLCSLARIEVASAHTQTHSHPSARFGMQLGDIDNSHTLILHNATGGQWDSSTGVGLLCPLTVMLSQDSMAGSTVRCTVCLCARACPLQTASHHLWEGRDKQSVWAEIRWEQTLGRLTVSESLSGELWLYGLGGPENSEGNTLILIEMAGKHKPTKGFNVPNCTQKHTNCFSVTQLCLQWYKVFHEHPSHMKHIFIPYLCNMTNFTHQVCS